MNGVAGCGKTTMIKQVMETCDCVVLSSTQSGAKEIGSNARTITSFLINSRVDGYVDTLIVDEAYMIHWGLVCLLIAMTGARRVILFGDDLQLPFIDRSPTWTTALCIKAIILIAARWT